MDPYPDLSRRRLLQRGVVLGAAAALGTTLSSCSPTDTGPAADSTPIGTPAPREDPTTTPTTPRTVVAYFSRAGENYYYGGRRDLEVGNTEVLARTISELLDCDLHRIGAANPYPDSYDATVERNSREQDDDARPAITNPLDSLEPYDTVLLGSPIWNVRPPMIMNTFIDSHDFTGLAVHPFVTYAVSGLGRTQTVYTDALAGARLNPGLAVRGEEVAEQRADVETWLRRARLISS